MYGGEIWTLEKAESQRTDAFKLWCWRRLLRVPWTARRSNHSVLKEISPEHSLEAQMLKLKLQHFGHLMWRSDSLEKTLMLGKIEGRRRRGQQRMRLLDGSPTRWTWVEQAPGVGDGQGSPMCCSPCAAVHGVVKSQKYWATELNMFSCSSLHISHLLLLPCPSSVLFWALFSKLRKAFYFKLKKNLF